jgi:3-oxoacyl-[acyl-carrier protein] reductase
MNLADAQVLITGGGRGIGRHLVARLAPEVRRIIVFERDGKARAALAVDLPKISCYSCDVTDPDAVRASLHEIEASGVQLNTLINNAGLIYSAPLVNLAAKQNRAHTIDAWRQVLAANLDSVFYVTRELVDQMVARRTKGLVINMSSIAASGNAGQSAYSAAKAGVNALTATWAKELGMMGIRFAAIAPGFIDTKSTRQALSEPILDKLKQQIPLRRLGSVDQIYQTVRFIIENDYINGTVINVDGGLVL